MTPLQLIVYLRQKAQSRDMVHHSHLERLFGIIGEDASHLATAEFWEVEPAVIAPRLEKAERVLALPRNVEAEAAYREAWERWQSSIGLERKRLGRVMDQLQPDIAEGTYDPRWQTFIDTLPGYRKFWGTAADRALKRLRRPK